MTTVSLNFRQSAFAQETGAFPICLLTLSHPSLDAPIRISTDPTVRLEVSVLDVAYGTVIQNTEYIYLPMTLKLPDDTDDGAGEMTIELDNIHRAYTSAIRSIHDPIECHVEIVMSNDLNTVEAQWPAFLLTNVRYDAHVISATLKQETLEGEPFPALTFSPAYFRGMF